MTKQELKIVFFGTPEFATTTLRTLVENGYNVAAVVTMPDKNAGRGRHLAFSHVKQYALEQNLPLLQPENLKDPEFLQALREIGADLFIVIAFRMLPEAVWAMPPLGTFNLHASLLPKYRGAAPINWAVINGEQTTGVTTFFLQHEIDTGDIIEQRAINIDPDENVGSVHDRLMNLGAEIVLSTVDHIIDGNITTIPQSQLINAGQHATPAPKIFRETCRINWTEQNARQVHNHIRGLSPYPAAWSTLTDQDGNRWELKIYETRLAESMPNLSAGQVAIVDRRLLVACSEGTLEITSVQTAGKRRMSADEFLRGLRYTGNLSFV